MIHFYYIVSEDRSLGLDMRLESYLSEDVPRPERIDPPEGWYWRCWSDQVGTEHDQLFEKVPNSP